MIAMLEEAEDVLRRVGCDMTADKVRKVLQAQQADHIGDATEIAQQAEPGLYAILYRDNWDGEGDTYHTLATRLDNGAWLDHESGASLLKYEGDAILRVWPLTDDKAQQQADPVARDVIAKLVALTRAVNIALDDSEERDGIDGREHVIGSVNFDAVCDALEALEELPDNKPGWAMNAADKAEWALRHLSATQPPAVPAEMTPDMMRAVQMRSELGAYATANLAGAYDLFAEFWRVAVEEVKKGGAKC